MNDMDKLKILIVDDRPENLIALESLLEAPDRKIVKASSGNEALGLLLENDYAVVLLDVQMPDMDGFETARLVRGLERTRYIPIIFVTAINKEQSHIAKGYEAGAVDYLFKPIIPEILTSKVKVFLDLHQKKNELRKALETIEEKNRIIDENRSHLQFALNEISSLIQQVAHNKGFSVRFSNPNLKKCYEVLDCRKEGCPCHGGEAMRCWQVAGTYCFESNAGLNTSEEKMCLECSVYKDATNDVIYQTGEHFNNMMNILEAQHLELEKAYADLKTAQSRILQQEKMASIGQLSAGVAHEINNPVGFIMSNLTSLRKYIDKLIEFTAIQSAALDESGGAESIGEKVRASRKALKVDYIIRDVGELLQESVDGANRIKTIVQNLKSFARLDEASQKPADINAGLESTINIVWNELKYKATLKKEYGDIPLILCNPGELNQVFMNMLINACHAIETQGEITVKTWFGEGYVHISIGDDGCGIPEEIKERIFEPFFTTKEVGKGTGLGLSIVYDIVKKHNGEILLDSKKGVGTTFTIKIPVQADDGANPPPLLSKETP